jgi:hypothetical protein
VKPLLLVAAAVIALAAAPHPRSGAAVATLTCVSGGPVSVAGQQIVPAFTQCLPLA